jgi:hypothetical protein
MGNGASFLVPPIRAKTRGPTRRPAWLAGGESDPAAGCDFVRDGRSIPPALPYIKQQLEMPSAVL